MPNRPVVAFVCVHNSCRSQMAEALGKHFAGDRSEFHSAVTEALSQLNSAEPVAHVTDFPTIAEYGVLSPPALVIDEKVLSEGKTLTTSEAKALLSESLGV